MRYSISINEIGSYELGHFLGIENLVRSRFDPLAKVIDDNQDLLVSLDTFGLTFLMM